MIVSLAANVSEYLDGSLTPKVFVGKEFKLLISYINVYILKR